MSVCSDPVRVCRGDCEGVIRCGGVEWKDSRESEEPALK